MDRRRETLDPADPFAAVENRNGDEADDEGRHAEIVAMELQGSDAKNPRDSHAEDHARYDADPWRHAEVHINGQCRVGSETEKQRRAEQWQPHQSADEIP